MSCECGHTVCCGLPSASDSAEPTVRELYRRPPRSRYPRHHSRRRLLHQHMSCPNTFGRSEELSTTSADELSVWASRRTRSDLPPLGGARRYKTDKSRFSLRQPRVCPRPASRRGSSRHRRTTTIVHHPCCLFDPKLCPVMKGSQHRHSLRPEDIDSETLRTTEELRTKIESFLLQHQQRQPQKAPSQPEATAQVPRQRQTNQMKSAQPSDPREKKCDICGNSQHLREPTVNFGQRYQRQPSPPSVGLHFPTVDFLTREVSSETADRLVDELSRRSAGPRAAHTPQRVNTGDLTWQQRNITSGATKNLFSASPRATGPRKGEAVLLPNIKMTDNSPSPPFGNIHQSRVNVQNMPRPRNTAQSPFLEEYLSRRPPLVLQQGNEMRPPTSAKTGPPVTQLDVEASYTMHSIAAARAGTTKNPDSANPRRLAPIGDYSYEEVTSQPKTVTINFQQTTRRAASEGAKAPDDVESPGRVLFTFGDPDADESSNHVGRADMTELRIMPQSALDSARLTARTFESDVSGLQQTENFAAEARSSSSNGDFHSGNQTPADSVGSLHHMDGVEKALKGWQTGGGDAAKVNGVHSQADKLSSPVPSIRRAAAVGDVNHPPGSQRGSLLASPSSRKSITSPTAHSGGGSHREVREPGNTSQNNVNVPASDDSAVYSRRSGVESFSKPDGTGDTSFCSDGCGSLTHRSNAQQSDKQQEAAKIASRGGTPRTEGGCKSTPNAEEKLVASSRATSRCSSAAASTKSARRRAKDRGGGDSTAGAAQSDDAKCQLTGDRCLSIHEQLDATRTLIVEYIDKALATVVNSPITEPSNSSSQPKLQTATKLTGRTESSDLGAVRECSSAGLSSELCGYVESCVKDSLLQQRPSKAAAGSPAEDRNNRKLLLKLQRDLTKNILTNLKRLEDIESLLHLSNGEGPSAPPTK